MAERELSILVKAKGAIQAARDIGKVDSAVGRIGSTAARGVGTAARNIAGLGVVAAGGIALFAKSGIASLADLEDATTQVEGAIAATGQKGQVAAGQVATWANDIERNVQAGFDDKAIVSATATLIRFGKVTPQNVKPAMQVMTDLAARTGDVDSASNLLSKALADPAKAAGKLARAGVILTKEQQKQIKTMTKAGDVAGAQAFLLGELTKVTKGAAAASAGPYRDSLNILTDVTEDAQRALGEGFLPVIMEASDLLSSELAKPSTIAGIREFGTGLAGGLRAAIGIAKNLPWASIGDAFRMGGAGAKAILDAFVGMPPWVQTAVLTGWGLNKLTGGAIGGIVGELGKGLIKGVLGMTAGVVNINAASVNGMPGGVPGGKPGIGSLLPGAFIATAIIAAAVPIGEAFASALPDSWKGRPGETGMNDPQRLLANARAEQDRKANAAGAGRFVTAGGFDRRMIRPPRQAVGGLSPDERQLSEGVKREIAAVKRIAESTAPSQKSAEAHLAQIKALQQTEAGRSSGDSAALRSVLSRLEAAIAGFNPRITVTVPARTVTLNQTRLTRTTNRPPGRGPLAD